MDGYRILRRRFRKSALVTVCPVRGVCQRTPASRARASTLERSDSLRPGMGILPTLTPARLQGVFSRCVTRFGSGPDPHALGPRPLSTATSRLPRAALAVPSASSSAAAAPMSLRRRHPRVETPKRIRSCRLRRRRRCTRGARALLRAPSLGPRRVRGESSPTLAPVSFRPNRRRGFSPRSSALLIRRETAGAFLARLPRAAAAASTASASNAPEKFAPNATCLPLPSPR